MLPVRPVGFAIPNIHTLAGVFSERRDPGSPIVTSDAEVTLPSGAPSRRTAASASPSPTGATTPAAASRIGTLAR